MGQKGSLMAASLPNIICWLAISFTKDTSFLYMGRLLEGFSVGIISYTVHVCIDELRDRALEVLLALSISDLNMQKVHLLPLKIHMHLRLFFVFWRAENSESLDFSMHVHHP